MQTGMHKHSAACFYLYCLQQPKLANIYYKILLNGLGTYITIIIQLYLHTFYFFNST